MNLRLKEIHHMLYSEITVSERTCSSKGIIKLSPLVGTTKISLHMNEEMKLYNKYCAACSMEEEWKNE